MPCARLACRSDPVQQRLLRGVLKPAHRFFYFFRGEAPSREREPPAGVVPGVGGYEAVVGAAFRPHRTPASAFATFATGACGYVRRPRRDVDAACVALKAELRLAPPNVGGELIGGGHHLGPGRAISVSDLTDEP